MLRECHARSLFAAIDARAVFPTPKIISEVLGIAEDILLDLTDLIQYIPRIPNYEDPKGNCNPISFTTIVRYSIGIEGNNSELECFSLQLLYFEEKIKDIIDNYINSISINFSNTLLFYIYNILGSLVFIVGIAFSVREYLKQKRCLLALESVLSERENLAGKRRKEKVFYIHYTVLFWVAYVGLFISLFYIFEYSSSRNNTEIKLMLNQMQDLVSVSMYTQFGLSFNIMESDPNIIYMKGLLNFSELKSYFSNKTSIMIKKICREGILKIFQDITD